MSRIREKVTYTQMIMLSFCFIILVGAFLLCLPISSRSGQWTSFLDAMFTATSATCVTGLVVFDTLTYWSGFGHVVIMLLIQIGGLGVMTCVAIIALIFRMRISVGERRLLMQSAGANQIGGIVKLILRIVKITAVVEGFGFIMLSIAFCPDMGFFTGIWKALFHSVSAFCNAGFDILGAAGKFTSLAGSEYALNPLVNFTIMILITTGGIGFIVWGDVLRKGFHFKKYEVHSKIVLLTSGTLLILGTAAFFIFEYDHSLAGMTVGEKLLASLFQSVSPRTAGFASIDLAKMSDPGTLSSIVLMFIGGSPGSTAGGIKTTTFIVILLGAFTSARRYGSITLFKRKLDYDTVVKASAIASVYLICVLGAVFIISAIENAPFLTILYECVSAIGTVGLSIGLTPTLSSVSEIVIILLMYTGRIGGLSLMLILAENRRSVPIERPTAKILIG